MKLLLLLALILFPDDLSEARKALEKAVKAADASAARTAVRQLTAIDKPAALKVPLDEFLVTVVGSVPEEDLLSLLSSMQITP